MTEACEALKVALKQEADGYMLTLRIKPEELPETVILANVNARFAVAFSEIGDDEQLKPKPVEVKSKRQRNSNVMRAGIVCGEPAFQKFLETKKRLSWNGAIGKGADKAADAMRVLIGVESRKEIATNELALAEFDRLMGEYEMWKRGQ